ncbi:MAG: hypothetical protein AABY15_01845 [Nanoarchaeota archaeon]
MQILLLSIGILGAIILTAVFKMRTMPQYKISKEKDINGETEKWFVKVRKGWNYFYLHQTEDFPGYEEDVFKTSSHQTGGQETEILAEKIIINHRMTTVNGIEREGV